MQYIAVVLTSVISTFLIKWLLILMRRPVSAKEQTVTLPKLFPIIGTIASVVFMVVAGIALFLNESTALFIIFIVISICGAALIAAYCNCRIIYDESTFTSKSFFGCKHTYTYDQITAIQDKSADIKIYIGKRVVRIDELAVGKYEFLAFANIQYQKLNNGKSIPSRALKTDIFNGNVERPGEFVFAYIVISLFCIGMIVLCAIISVPRTADDLEYASLAFERYEIQDKDLLLYAKDDPKYYIIPEYEALLSDANEFISLCNSGEIFDVGFVVYDKADVPHYAPESIKKSDGTVCLSMEAVHDYQRGNSLVYCLLLVGFAVVCFAYIAVSIYVGRNPEKFSRRFIRLFFKDGYIRLPDAKRNKY